MLTDRQLEAAERALKDHKSRELQRRIMLRIYRDDQKQSERLQLPFRMIHRHEFIPGELPPSDFFPHLSRIGRDEQGNPYTLPDVQEITPEAALYYFTRHLAANMDNLMQYRPSDWTGSPTTPQEAEKQRQAYFDRIEDFRRNPEKYDTEPHPMPEHPERIYFMFTGDDHDDI